MHRVSDGRACVLITRNVVVYLRHRTTLPLHQGLFATHLRIDALLFGVFLSHLFHQQPDLWQRLTRARRLIFVVSLALLAPSVYFEIGDGFTDSIGYSMYYLGFGGILIAAITGDAGRRAAPMWERALAFIGTYSYSIYLWHTAVRRWAPQALEHVTGVQLGYVGATVLYVVGSLLVGVAMASLVEMPFLRLRDASFPSRSGRSSEKADRSALSVNEVVPS